MFVVKALPSFLREEQRGQKSLESSLHDSEAN